MCCGNQREQISNQAHRVSGAAPANWRSAGSVVPPAAVRRHHRGVMFEYEGAHAMTVVSPLTQRSYRFAHPGARITVDPHDTTWLTFTPNLRRTG